MEQLPDIPAFRHASRISTDPDLGPGVPTILVIAGKNDCNTECQGKNVLHILYHQELHSCHAE